MIKTTTTYVFQINNRLVIADSIEEAIKTYRQHYYPSNVEIKHVYKVGTSETIPNYDAIIENKSETVKD